MKRRLRLSVAGVAVAVAASALPASSPAQALEGCTAANPGPLTCSYTAKEAGSVVAVGRGVSVSTSSGRYVTGWSGSLPSWSIVPLDIHPGDHVIVSALLPGSAVYAGDPLLVQARVVPPSVGAGPLATPEASPSAVTSGSFVGAPTFVTGTVVQGNLRYLLTAYTQTDATGAPTGVRVFVTKMRWHSAPSYEAGQLDPYMRLAAADVLVDLQSAGFTYVESSSGLSSLSLSADLPSIGPLQLTFRASRRGYRVLAEHGMTGYGTDRWFVESEQGHAFDTSSVSGTIGGRSVSYLGWESGAWGVMGSGFASVLRPDHPLSG